MAPPKVNLAAKTPETEPQVNETDTEAKADKLDFPPTVVTVNSERNVQALRAQRINQRNRRLACGIMLVTIVAIATLGTITLVHRLRNRHRKFLECRYGKAKLPEHVKVDHDKRLIYAHHGHDQKEHTPALHTLHAYDSRMVAYKDEEKSICYIDRLNETFEEGYERWLLYERHGRPDGKILAQVSSRPIEVEVLKHICDIHIYLHCRNSTSYWYMEIEKREEQDMVVVHV